MFQGSRLGLCFICTHINCNVLLQILKLRVLARTLTHLTIHGNPFQWPLLPKSLAPNLTSGENENFPSPPPPEDGYHSLTHSPTSTSLGTVENLTHFGAKASGHFASGAALSSISINRRAFQ